MKHLTQATKQSAEPIYRCRSCHGVYREVLSSCDCAPGKLEWDEGVMFFDTLAQPVIAPAANIREALEALVSNNEHAESGGIARHQKGSQTWQLWRDAEQALSITENMPQPVDATPQPTNPYGWIVNGNLRLFTGKYAEHDAKNEAAHCGGTAKAVALFDTPQPVIAPDDASNDSTQESKP